MEDLSYLVFFTEVWIYNIGKYKDGDMQQIHAGFFEYNK